MPGRVLVDTENEGWGIGFFILGEILYIPGCRGVNGLRMNGENPHKTRENGACKVRRLCYD